MNSIESCIAELDGKIADLQTVRANLVNAMPILYPAGVAAKAPSAPAEIKKHGPYKKQQSVATTNLAPKKPRPLDVRKPDTKPSAAAAKARDAGNPTTQDLLDGKATSVGGAMKLFIRNQTRFTGTALLALVNAHKGYAALLAERDPGLPGINLAQWTSDGYLTRDGKGLEATYTVTAAGKEWFAK